MILSGLGSGHSIVGSLPFTFHFYTAVGCWMPEPGIDARQWVLTRLKHTQVDRGLLVGRRVSYFVRVASGELVDGCLGRVHGHVKLPPLHPVSHHSAHANFAISRDELHPSATLNPALFSK